MQQDECAICCCVIKNKDVMYKMDCVHKFHRQCMQKWINTNKPNATCPVCRTPVTQNPTIPTHDFDYPLAVVKRQNRKRVNRKKPPKSFFLVNQHLVQNTPKVLSNKKRKEFNEATLHSIILNNRKVREAILKNDNEVLSFNPFKSRFETNNDK